MKRYLITTFLMIYALFATNIPQTTYSSVTNLHGNSISLSSPLGVNGMSGVIVRNVGGSDYILAYVKQTSQNQATIIDTDPLNGNPLANIKPIVQVGDRVIGGFLYSKVIVLAPNKEAFNQIQSQFGVSSQNPDYFLAFLKGSNPSSSDYKKYAKLMGIGLFLIAKNGIVKVYDPISQQVVAKGSYTVSNKSTISPFYNNFN